MTNDPGERSSTDVSRVASPADSLTPVASLGHRMASASSSAASNSGSAKPNSFQAVPDRSRGPPRPKAESAVQRGLATSRKPEDQVVTLAEKTDFRFHPELDRLGIRGGVALPGDLARGGEVA